MNFSTGKKSDSSGTNFGHILLFSRHIMIRCIYYINGGAIKADEKMVSLYGLAIKLQFIIAKKLISILSFDYKI